MIFVKSIEKKDFNWVKIVFKRFNLGREKFVMIKYDIEDY